MKKSMKKSFAALAGGAMLMVASFAANANLITNGNFATGTAAGWSSVGAVTVIPYSAYGMAGTAAGSLYGAAFGGGEQAATGVVSQAIATVVGLTYTISFDYGSYSGNTLATQSLKVSVTDVGAATTLLSQTISTVGSSTVLASIYSLFPTYTFTAIGSSTLLSFSDVSLAFPAVDGFLTNVAVNANALPVSPVPLPGTIALLGLAFAGLLASRKRLL